MKMMNKLVIADDVLANPTFQPEAVMLIEQFLRISRSAPEESVSLLADEYDLPFMWDVDCESEKEEQQVLIERCRRFARSVELVIVSDYVQRPDKTITVRVLLEEGPEPSEDHKVGYYQFFLRSTGKDFRIESFIFWEDEEVDRDLQQLFCVSEESQVSTKDLDAIRSCKARWYDWKDFLSDLHKSRN